jgi:hypothetical protein
MRSTIVLVHGAFAESASWDRVIDVLVSRGHGRLAVSRPDLTAQLILEAVGLRAVA